MYEGTPNEEYLNPWIDRMEERYQYDRLKQMSLDRLHGMEFEVHSRFKIFKAGFPHRESFVQGEFRAVLSKRGDDTRVSLTPTEKERLRQVRLDLEHEIYRARGYREERRREHRSDTLNSVVDLFDAVSRTVLSVRATISELTPW